MKSVIVAFIIFITTALHAAAQKSEVFIAEGKAIKGYDPVAFFTQSKAVKGSDSLAYTYKGATWLFSSNENLEAFKKDPEHYAPQYGGYCAYGTAAGHKAPTQTDTWSIVDGKLYFNYNMKVKQSWTKDQPALIEKADKQWPTVKDQQ
ncbi:MAG: YHS domain protein [Citrobacter freundii]|nr:MAG: YHS domain protein [Citrobacter freundii]